MPDSVFKRIGSVISTKIDAVETTLQTQIDNITVDKASVGLGNVDNTSDLNKPISTATQTALNAKQDADANLVADASYVHTDNNFTTAERNKLAAIESGATNFSLPTATVSVLGGVKVDGTSITVDGDGIISAVPPEGSGGADITLVRYLSQPGSLSLFTGKARWYPPQAVNVLWLEASVDTPSAGSGITAVLKKNGTIVDSVTITAGANKSSRVTLDSIDGTVDDYFTVDVTSVGSTTAGSDLIIAVAYEYNNNV